MKNSFLPLIFLLSIFTSVCDSATIDEVYAHEYGVWSIGSSDQVQKRIIIHNIKTAKDEGLFHIEVVSSKDASQPWKVTRIKSHVAIEPEALIEHLQSPLNKGKVYPEHFNFQYKSWQQQQNKIICETELFECIK